MLNKAGTVGKSNTSLKFKNQLIVNEGQYRHSLETSCIESGYIVVNTSHNQQPESIMANAKIFCESKELAKSLQNLIAVIELDGWLEDKKAALDYAKQVLKNAGL